MRVSEIMTCVVETIDSNANMVEAAQKMHAFEIGALPVSEKNELVGIITDRGIAVNGVADGKEPSKTSVKEIMTSEISSCNEDDDIYDVADTMEEKSVHRLLVVNDNKEPVGFVSLSDFAVKSNNEHLTWEVLERISEPACPHR